MIAWPTRLAEPAWLFLLPLALIPWWTGRHRLSWPDVGVEDVARFRLGTWLRGNLPTLLRSVAIVLAILALARPQRLLGSRIERSSGIAMIVALDRSASMSRTRPDSPEGSRLEVARRVLDDFVARRPHDLIGLVAFANWPDTLCPPTLDHAVLRESIRAIAPATRAENGTNLGDALAWATRDALSVNARRRVIVLITDGRHEPDRSTVPRPLDPVEAARLAHELGVVVHAVGIGEPGQATDLAGLDARLLAAIAAAGGGRDFLAASPDDLLPVLNTLDQIETGQVESRVFSRYREDWPLLLGAAVAVLALAWLARRSGGLP